MSAKRRIGVVTGARSDYGLLYWPMKAIAADPALELQVIATGMHLSPEFGLTVRDIEADGFPIAARVEMLLSGDTPAAITKSLGVGVIGFADALKALAPDLLFVPGDRFEILAAAQAAMIARVPIAHLHGGETSEDSFDEGARHAITKMAQWHFVAAEPYRKRVVQMGEAPARVFNVGAPGLDHLRHQQWLSRAELERDLGLPLGKPLFLVTYHPRTLSDESPAVAMDALLSALGDFPEATLVFTYPNADTGGRILIDRINAFVAGQSGRAAAFASLGARRYLSLVREADVMIGNSSSGLTEAPALRTAAVNLGDRQKGRLKATSVIDAAEDRASIVAAIRRALSPAFRATLPDTVSLYGAGDASAAIVKQLKSPLPGLKKTFFDLDHAH